MVRTERYLFTLAVDGSVAALSPTTVNGIKVDKMMALTRAPKVVTPPPIAIDE